LRRANETAAAAAGSPATAYATSRRATANASPRHARLVVPAGVGDLFDFDGLDGELPKLGAQVTDADQGAGYPEKRDDLGPVEKGRQVSPSVRPTTSKISGESSSLLASRTRTPAAAEFGVLPQRALEQRRGVDDAGPDLGVPPAAKRIRETGLDAARLMIAAAGGLHLKDSRGTLERFCA
jgi:hypothetical protein